MSNPWLPKPVALEATHLAYPTLVPCPPEVAEAIRKATGVEGAINRLDSRLQPPRGYYLAGDLFLKVVSEGEVERQVQADDLACDLAERGAPVNTMLAEYPRPFGQGFTVLAYARLRGKYMERSARNLYRLGEALAAMHRAMAASIHREAICREGRDRLTMLRTRCQKVMTGQVVYPGAKSIVSEGKELLDLLEREPQIIHGDLNYGNVIVGPNGPLFFDFETALCSWLPLQFDIAFAVERFARRKDVAETARLATAFLSGYAAVSGAPLRDPDDLSLFMRSAALRGLLILAEMEGQGIDCPTAEWIKFVRHDRLARQQAGMLRQLAAEFCT